MGSIRKEGNKFLARIHMKDVEINKTFFTEEDAKLYIFYKERLITNMENFAIDIEERVTIRQLIELKSLEKKDKSDRDKNEFSVLIDKFESVLNIDKFYDGYNYNDWLEAAKNLMSIKVWKGSKSNLRDMSIGTLRRIYATMSSCVSHAKALGINLVNHPLTVIQLHINPILKKNSLV